MAGRVNYINKSNGHYVWPVRAVTTTPAQVWKTGQTTSYETGDDGDLQKGVALPSPRFTDNGNGTITDNLTGLIWLKDATCFGTGTWSTALSDTNSLASGSCGLSDGSSAGDWRPPNRKELHSLTDYSQYNPAFPSGHPFTNVQSIMYWSATTSAYGPADGTSGAWAVNMWDGDLDHYGKSNTSLDVWPVRAGQSGSSGSPDISVSPTSVDFGTVEDLGTSTPQTFTVSNDGTSNLTISSLSFTAITGTYTSDFTIQNDNCSGQTIAVSGNCTVQVLFSGLAIGSRSVNLSIPSNDPDTPILNVPLSGFSLSIPTLSEWGMVVFVLLLLFSGIFIIFHRRDRGAR